MKRNPSAQVLELEPGHRSAYVMRGEANRQLGNEQEAIEDYTRALFIDPTDVDAYLVRGEANLADHNYLDALHDFQKALDLQVIHCAQQRRATFV